MELKMTIKRRKNGKFILMMPNGHKVGTFNKRENAEVMRKHILEDFNKLKGAMRNG